MAEVLVKPIAVAAKVSEMTRLVIKRAIKVVLTSKASILVILDVGTMAPVSDWKGRRSRRGLRKGWRDCRILRVPVNTVR